MLGLSVFFDFKSRKIPNKLTFPAIILGLVVNIIIAVVGHTSVLESFGFSLLGFLAGIGIYFIPFALGGFGAGDVKLMGAVGAFMGAEFTFWTGIYSFIIGGVLAILTLLFKTLSGNKEENVQKSFKKVFNYFTYKVPITPSKTTLPFSLSIILAVLVRMHIEKMFF